MKLKVCGLKYKDNIEQVAGLNPDYIGFIFYPQSKRFVGDNFVMPTVNSSLQKVGVFVNAELNELKEKVKKYQLDFVQLHGSENVNYCQELKDLVKIIKAFGVDEQFDFDTTIPYQTCCDYFLFDTKTPEHGGSGKIFDWNVLKKYNNKVPYFLSGGIGLEEIEKLKTEKLNIHAIDVNSKFEIEPGMKDIEKLKVLNEQLATNNK